MAEISESPSSNTDASIGKSEHGGVLPRPPLDSGGDTESSPLRKINVDEEKLAGRERYQTDLDHYKSERAVYAVISTGTVTNLMRSVAQRLLRSAVQHQSQVAEGLTDDNMLWRLDVVVGALRTEVEGYPGGGLMVMVRNKRVLAEITEDDLAVLLASAIVDIIDSQSNEERNLQARAIDGCMCIPQRARSYLTKLGLFAGERERVFSKDRMIVRIIQGAGYERESLLDWYNTAEPPHFYKFNQPSYESRARRLRAWLAKDKMPMGSLGKRQTALKARWYPDGERMDDFTPVPVEVSKRVIKGKISMVSPI